MAWLVLAVFLFGPIASLPGAAQEDPGDWARLPVIKEGDSWTYELTGRQKGEVVNTVAAQETKTNHLGAKAETLRIESHGTVTSEQTGTGFMMNPYAGLGETTHDIDADKWVRVDDHATLQYEGSSTISSSAGTHITTIHVMEAYDPPMVQYFFPFTKDFEWTSWADFYLERGSEDPREGEVTRTVKVTDQESVSVRAGSFDTWRIEITTEYDSDDGNSRFSTNIVQWWSQEACGLAKEERYDSDGELITRMVLTEVSCSGEYRQEPGYGDRQVELREAPHQPPWLDDQLESDTMPQGENDLTASALPSGPVVWGALGGLAGVSLLFLVLGRTRLMR